MYRIGELANAANVSKRTIDYYTSIGLLKAQRSSANYRIYTDTSLEDLKLIEEYKKMRFPLEEIKRKLDFKNSRSIQEVELEQKLSTVALQMKQLHHDISNLASLIEKLDENHKKALSKKLFSESIPLMETLRSVTFN